jgi:hypothetical protein
MKVRLLLILTVISITQRSLAQTTDSLNDQLVGYWELKSVKFSSPVDINKDGVKSADAFEEYTDCLKDQQLELSGDMTAKVTSGTHATGCKAQEIPYTWHVIKAITRDSRYVNGKRFINDHVSLVLVLKATNKNDESLRLLISDVSKKILTVKSELADGTDSTSEATLTYKKNRKK